MKVYRIYLSLLCALVVNTLQAQDTLYWYGGTSADWTDSSNWTDEPGVPKTVTAPTGSTTVIFNTAATYDCVLDDDVSIEELVIVSNSSVDLNGYDLTTTGDLTQHDEVFDGGSGTITIGGKLHITGGSFISTSGTLNTEDGILQELWETFDANGGKVKVTGSGTIDMYDFLYDLEIASGTETVLDNHLPVLHEVTLNGLLNTNIKTLYLANSDTGAVDGTGGVILELDNGDFGLFIWVVGENTGHYTIPLWSDVSSSLIPIEFTVTTAGTGPDGSFLFTTGWLSSSKPQDLFGDGLGFYQADGSNNAGYTGNRAWFNVINDYDSQPIYDLTFHYDDAVVSGISMDESRARGQYFDEHKWSTLYGSVDAPNNKLVITDKEGEGSDVTNIWCLVDSTSRNYNTYGGKTGGTCAEAIDVEEFDLSQEYELTTSNIWLKFTANTDSERFIFYNKDGNDAALDLSSYEVYVGSCAGSTLMSGSEKIMNTPYLMIESSTLTDNGDYLINITQPSGATSTFSIYRTPLDLSGDCELDVTDELHFDGCESIYPPLDGMNNVIHDRFNDLFNNPFSGNNYLKSGAPASAAVVCNGFRLIFEDIEDNTGIGFDDASASPCTPGISLGEERVNTICEVLDYITDVIDVNGTPEIFFLTSGTGTNNGNVLGTGTPLYATGAAAHTYRGGFLFDHITTGVNPNAGGSDAQLWFHFGDIQGFSVNSCVGDCDAIDFYSIALHEITHALGFVSAISPNNVNGPYSLFDEYILNSSSASLTTSGVFTASVGDITQPCWYFETNNTSVQPVYSPSNWQNGSSLSHFDNARSNLSYVMNWGGTGEANRFYTQAELEVLQDLGYSLNTSNLNITGVQYPTGVEDNGMTTIGQEVCINVLSNDNRPNGPISISSYCGLDQCDGSQSGALGVRIMNGGGTAIVNPLNPNEICFTPAANFIGTAHLQYCIEDANGVSSLVNPHDPVDVFIEVLGDYCPDDPCNFVCNGGFEIGLDDCTCMDFTSFLTQAPVASWSAGRSPDLIRFLTACSLATVPSCVGFLSVQAQTVPVPNPRVSGVTNNRYVRMINSRNFSTPCGEYICSQLTTLLTPGETYVLSLYANGTGTTATSGLRLSINESRPTLGDSWPVIASLDCGLLNQDFSISGGFAVTNNVWDQYTFTFTAPSNTSGEQWLVLEPNGQGGGTYFVDDVRLVATDPQLDVTTTVSAGPYHAGDNVTYTIEICNNSGNTITNVDLQDFLPPALNFVSSTFSSGLLAHNITSILPGPSNCQTITLTAQIDNNAPLNSPITNCIELTGGATNCEAFLNQDNCSEIIVEAADLAINIVGVPDCGNVGNNFTYDVVIDNLGAGDLTDIVASHIMAADLTYVSHTIAFPNTFDQLTGEIEIGSLDASTSVTLSITATITSNFCNNLPDEYCASIVSVAETEQNLINNQDCVEFPVCMTLSVTSTPETSCDGTATVVATGGTPPYSYIWNDPDGQTTATATGLSAGSYEVTVSDNNSCVRVASVVVSHGSLTFPNTVQINNTTVWFFRNISVGERIIVMPGASLNIVFSSVQFSDFDPNGEPNILVLWGGQLNIVHSVLSGNSGCETMWNGISVIGNPNAAPSSCSSQMPWLCQGEINIQGSTIRDSRKGVLLGYENGNINFQDSPYGGGIITCNSVNGVRNTFLNNGYSIRMSPMNVRRKTLIKNTDFLATDDFLDDQLDVGTPPRPFPYPVMQSRRVNTFIDIRDTDIVGIDGCTFENTNSTLTPYLAGYHNGIGIRAVDTYIDVGSTIGNEFTNLHQGILVSGLQSTGTKIVGNTFVENSQGVSCSGVETVEVSENYFDIPGGSYVNRSPVGVHLVNTGNFRVQDNQFAGVTGSGTFTNTYGLVVRNSGGLGGRIYSNSFIKVDFGMQLEGMNHEVIAKCNSFANDGYSHGKQAWANRRFPLVPGSTTIVGALKDQGQQCGPSSNAAGNKWMTNDQSIATSITCSPTSDRDMYVQAPINFQYWHNTTDENNELTILPHCGTNSASVAWRSNSVFDCGQSFSNSTPSTCDDAYFFRYFQQEVDASNIASFQYAMDVLKEDLKDSLNASLSVKTSILGSMDSGGSTSEILDSIADTGISSEDLKDILLGYSSLSDEVLSAAIKRSTPMDEVDLRDVLIANNPLGWEVLFILNTTYPNLNAEYENSIYNREYSGPYDSLRTEYSEIASKIKYIKGEILQIENELRFQYINIGDLESELDVLESSTLPVSKILLAQRYLNEGEYSSVEDVLDTLASWDDPINELEYDEYVSLMSLLSDIMQDTIIYEADSADVEELYDMSDSYTLSGTLAKSVLMKIRGEEFDFEILEPLSGGTLKTSEDDQLSGVEPLAEQDHFNLFPNPTKGNITLRYSFNGRNAEFLMFDLYGRKVFHKELEGHSSEEHIDNMSIGNGVYLYKVLVEGQEYKTGKVVKIDR